MMSRPSLFVCAGTLAALVVSGPASAQSPREGQSQDRHKWWASERVQKEVGITAEQAQTLEAVFQTLRPELRAHWAELDGFEREVSDLVTAGTATEAQVIEAVARTEAARAALYRARTLMLYRMYRVLSADQRVRLQGFHKRLDSARSTPRGSAAPQQPK